MTNENPKGNKDRDWQQQNKAGGNQGQWQQGKQQQGMAGPQAHERQTGQRQQPDQQDDQNDQPGRDAGTDRKNRMDQDDIEETRGQAPDRGGQAQPGKGQPSGRNDRDDE